MANTVDLYRVTDEDGETYWYESIEEAEENFGELGEKIMVEVGTWNKTGDWTQAGEIAIDEEGED